MDLALIDVAVFLGFVAVVVSFSLWKSRQRRTDVDFFLAGRGLVWWLIGFSLIAANISTEQFVGMNGSSAGNVGFAIASYDWIAAISLVVVSLFFLPRLLKCGIYTIPEYLEYRYNAVARGIMSVYMMIIYTAVTISAVIYSGALTIHTIFEIDLYLAVVFIVLIASLYASVGGLKAVAWADLLQGSSLMIGGLIVLGFGLHAVGGLDRLFDHQGERMRMILPADHPELPWSAMILGIWIPNFYYWGFNQFIAQRALAARSLKEGQMGVLFAAGLQVLLPMIIVLPGIIALQLYGDTLANQDAAYPMLIKHLIPVGLRGFVFAALAGAVISSLASMINSASTIFTMDIYKRHIQKQASQRSTLLVGRLATIVIVLIGGSIAPSLGNPKFRGIFHFIQDFQGYVTPGILACFLFGFFSPRTSARAAITGLLINVPIYGLLHLPMFDHIAFLNKMAITFLLIVGVLFAFTILSPLKKPKVMKITPNIDMSRSRAVYWIGAAIVAVTISLYLVFW